MRPSAEALPIPLDLINEPPHQLRLDFDADALRALADDIGARGLLQRIRLHHVPDSDRFVVCSGHRRFLAMRMLGWVLAPADVVPPCADCTGDSAAENLQRADLTPLEEATYLDRLRSTGSTVPQLAHLSRRSLEWVENRLMLLDYPNDIRAAVHSHKLALAVARQLAQVDHDGYRLHLLRDALDNGITARTAAVWVQHYLAERPRLIANQETIEHIAAQRDQYRILAPCDYCGQSADFEHTRVWRLCAGCHNALANAKNEPTQT